MRSVLPTPGALLLIVLLTLGLRLFAAWSIPLGSGSLDPNCAPDEISHLNSIRGVADGSLPVWPATPSLHSPFVQVPYAVHAAFLRLAPWLDAPGLYRFPPVRPDAANHLVTRMGSVFWGLVTVLALATAAGRWTGSARAATFAGLIVAAYPQLVFIGAYNNADAYTIAAGALHVLAIAHWARTGESEEGLIPLAIASGLVLLGKASGFFLLPTTALWVGWSLWQRRLRPWRAVIAAAAALAVAGPFLVHNAIRTGGDPFGVSIYREFLASNPQSWGTLASDVPMAPVKFVVWLWQSAVGQFGNMHLLLPRAFYVVAAVLLVIGLTAMYRQLGSGQPVIQRGLAWLLASAAVNLVLNVYNSWFVEFAPQGRYILLVTLVFTLLAAWGPAWRRNPGAWGRWPVAYLGFILLTAAWSLWTIHTNPCLPS